MKDILLHVYIRLSRESIECSQEEFAKATELPVEAIIEIEAGARKPEKHELFAIAKFLAWYWDVFFAKDYIPVEWQNRMKEIAEA